MITKVSSQAPRMLTKEAQQPINTNASTELMSVVWGKYVGKKSKSRQRDTFESNLWLQTDSYTKDRCFISTAIQSGTKSMAPNLIHTKMLKNFKNTRVFKFESLLESWCQQLVVYILFCSLQFS